MTIMPLQRRGITDSRLVFGCMSLGGNWDDEPPTKEDCARAEQAVEAALSIGITMFDHADIYCRTKSETVFGEMLKSNPGLREQLVLQSKVGIRLSEGSLPNRYDFSKEHILGSVDGILKRLHTDYLDILLLHRPDSLMEPDEVAEALGTLKAQGKVRHFGVSNMTSSQIRLLQSAFSEPFVVNQLQLGLGHLDWLDQGVFVNRSMHRNINFADGILEYCRMEDVQLQAWGPLAQGRFSGRPVDNETEEVKRTAKLVREMAERNETTREAIVLGWLMRHPAMIQPVIGTLDPKRIAACADAERQAGLMTRDEWYKLYISAQETPIP